MDIEYATYFDNTKSGYFRQPQEGLYSMLKAFIAIGLNEPLLGTGMQQLVQPTTRC